MIGSASRLRARVRGVLGLGVIGGGVGFVAGGVWGVLSSMVRAGVVFELDYFRFLLRMGIGNATGFMLIGRRRSLERGRWRCSRRVCR